MIAGCLELEPFIGPRSEDRVNDEDQPHRQASLSPPLPTFYYHDNRPKALWSEKVFGFWPLGHAPLASYIPIRSDHTWVFSSTWYNTHRHTRADINPLWIPAVSTEGHNIFADSPLLYQTTLKPTGRTLNNESLFREGFCWCLSDSARSTAGFHGSL